MREQKYITPLKSHSLPHSVVSLSVKTVAAPYAGKSDGVLEVFHCAFAAHHTVRDGVSVNCIECSFSTPSEFWAWIPGTVRHGKTTWIVADDLAMSLTALGVWNELKRESLMLLDIRDCIDTFGELRTEKRPWKGLFVDADPPNILSVRLHNRGVLCFVDLRNYFDGGIASVSKALKLPQMLPCNARSPDDAWISGAKRDAQIISKGTLGLIDWLKCNKLGTLKMTAASIAMSAYRTKFLGKPIKIERPDSVKQLERQSYYGGRCEVLHQGVYPHRVWEFDVQSMYASVMLNNAFPVECVCHGDARSSPFANNADPGFFTCSEVLIQSENATYPIKFRNATLWCCGHFWTTLCGPELRRAWTLGHIVGYGNWSQYRCVPIFREYVDYFWAMREEYRRNGNELYRQLCKLMLVGLFGKFAQRSPRWQVCDLPPDEWAWGTRVYRDFSTKETRTFRSIAGVIYEQAKPSDAKGTFTAISSWTTSYARERIAQLVGIAGTRNTLYVVTDALYVNANGRHKLQDAGEVSSGTLGKLSEKYSGNSAEFSGVHSYIIGSKRVFGGATLNHHIEADGTIVEHVRQSMPDVVSHEPLPGVVTYTRRKKPLVQHKRGIVMADGWIKPLWIKLPLPEHRDRFRQLDNLPGVDELCQPLESNASYF